MIAEGDLIDFFLGYWASIHEWADMILDLFGGELEFATLQDRRLLHHPTFGVPKETEKNIYLTSKVDIP